jgi:glycosyltransferase involved in cell wall biosynthesis
MKILIIEPFFTGSHRQWAEDYKRFSKHKIEILSLKGRHWKWRMFGGAVSLAEDFLKSNINPDLILATDMLDLTTFMALTRNKLKETPVAIYFHENQITYPWSDDDGAKGEQNRQYGFINYTSALAADAVFFNSDFHRKTFGDALKTFLKAFPDRRELQNIQKINQKSQTLPLGMNLKALSNEHSQKKNQRPVILWNHRWEYDKNPEHFFQTLFQLKSEGIAFKLIVLGESYQKAPPVFEKAKEELKDEIIHFGYAEDRTEYTKLLHLADILPVTSNQDFFGGSIVEAIYCNCYPILPNRLAFPEHIPETEKGNHLYNSEEDLLPLLKKVLQKDILNKKGHYQNFVSQYDWSTLATKYDEALEKVKK